MAKKPFELPQRSLELADQFSIEPKSFIYRTDDEIAMAVGNIVKDKMNHKMDDRLLAIKYRLPIELIPNLFKDKKYGAYVGKPYSKKELIKVIGDHEGFSKTKMYEIFSDRKVLTVYDIEEAIRRGDIKEFDGNVDLSPILVELAKFDIRPKHTPKIRSAKTNKELSLGNSTSIWYVKNKIHNAKRITDVQPYESLNRIQKGKVREFAMLVADDVITVLGEELYVGLDDNKVEQFISMIA